MIHFICLGLFLSLASGSPANNSDSQRLSKSLFEVPLVPGVGGGDDDHARHWDDHHTGRHDHREQQYDITNYQELSPPCKLLLRRLKERILRDQATIVVHSNAHYLRSAEMSGFNSFVVNECTTLATGVMVLGLEFNEITITGKDDRNFYDVSYSDYHDNKNSYDRNSYDRNSYDRNSYDRNQYDRNRYDRNRYDRNTYDRNRYDQDKYDSNSYDNDSFDSNSYDSNSYDSNSYDRNSNKDRINNYDKNSNNRINNRADRDLQKGEFRDYSIPLVDSFQRRNSEREGYLVPREDERDRRDRVQVYGVVMEYGYVSKSAALSYHGRPLTGVRINLSNVESRPTDSDGVTMMSAFREDLERELEIILEEVITEIKSLAGTEQGHQRYKRSLQLLDKEIAELEGLSSKNTMAKLYSKYFLNRNKNCRCKRDIGSRKVNTEKERKYHETKSRKNKKQKQNKKFNRENKKQKNSERDRETIDERRQTRIQQRKDKRLRKQKKKKNKGWRNCSCEN